MRPIVGITGNYNYTGSYYWLSKYYITSIHKVGGTAVILPPVEDEGLINHYITICDGFLFSGGGDLDSYYWGELPEWELGEINPIRDSFEYKLAQKILGGSLPVLGICRGCQVLNVAMGGTLIQNINSTLCHQQKAPRNYPFHAIVIEENTTLHKIVKTQNIRVNSFHHQAIKKPGKDLRVSAVAPDGTIEAVESTAHPFAIGVQWHPECLNDKHSYFLFKALVESSSRCCGYR